MVHLTQSRRHLLSIALALSTALYCVLPGQKPNYYNRALFVLGNIRWIIMLSFPYVEAWLSANKTYLRMILWPIVVLLLLMDVLSDGLTGFTPFSVLAIVYWGDILGPTKLWRTWQDTHR